MGLIFRTNLREGRIAVTKKLQRTELFSILTRVVALLKAARDTTGSEEGTSKLGVYSA
jgi:hypothetical protein